MKYKFIERINPANPASLKKRFARPVNAGKFTIKRFVEEMAGHSPLTCNDVEKVQNDFPNGLPVFLKLGMSVQPDGFCPLRLGISGEGADAEEQFSAAKIRNVKTIFTPNSALKPDMKEDIAFEQEQ
ncbi:MAG: hypothetical protein LBG28_00325 [Tannerella sp.]|jgi:hypothetical protein|nr:hypothetical protein [Tannerella sp.]